MSYELDYERKVSCPCGNGQIIKKSYSNDWNQTRLSIYIECEKCEKEYHVESETKLYLVPNGENLHRNSNYNTFETPFFEELCLCYPIDVLNKVYDVLCKSTTYSKIKDERTRFIVRQSKTSINRTMRISSVKKCVLEAIQKYNDVIINYDKETKRIADVESRCIIVKGL